jgi:CRP/FNR family transcriptional regulator, cyclic AMP receptor protein
MMWTDILGYTASAAVLATFCMNTMRALRILALVSNVLFISYGYFDSLYPVLVLHAILLPMNLLRLMQSRRPIHDIPNAPLHDTCRGDSGGRIKIL